ncbi:hypothetical protein E2C01_094971 [Portunus trituberculatus]|uniref:Uncharacterized protein n=1 Tax=Portunus trituberculatus TaxID=210409 RepID=A0A5B7JRW9_PORTR|nr:hypothetical protein [Portunus trituberculatus]
MRPGTKGVNLTYFSFSSPVHGASQEHSASSSSVFTTPCLCLPQVSHILFVLHLPSPPYPPLPPAPIQPCIASPRAHLPSPTTRTLRPRHTVFQRHRRRTSSY